MLWKPREDIGVDVVGSWTVLDVELLVCQLCGPALLDCPEVGCMQMDKRVIVSVHSEIGAPQVMFKHLCYHPFQSQQFQLEGVIVLIISLSSAQAPAAVGNDPFPVHPALETTQPTACIYLEQEGERKVSICQNRVLQKVIFKTSAPLYWVSWTPGPPIDY